MADIKPIAGVVEGIRSRKDNTWTITFGTNELSPADVSQVSQLLNKFGFLAFKKEQFQQSELDKLAILKAGVEIQGKSKSQMLRSVLYLNWHKSDEQFTEFDDYYHHTMDKLINHFKAKLDE